ncbi:hypothetical protein C0R09_08195 [Brevibacillus laterosporus]|uniref:Non-ribosomal peptide synthetase A n=1 Tax=Brevibacillus laterosporus TaxID=1465 RepID=A0A6B9L038_BRELA|nr:amino acid adenylation domain-containing protein [Brevibacillus laterosporus]AUM64509.1 hypothetical protein C0R09_08195 [Brevibacillus laterosporus]QHB21814.1 non-ribosomal peptide synthetase A [Brevibacillus laterosporus]
MGLLVHDFLTDNLHKNKDNILLKEKGIFITHGELERRSNRFCNYLEYLGVNKQDRVALIMDSSINAVIAVVGIMKRGAIFVPINVNSSTANINYIIQETESSLLIVDGTFQSLLNNLEYIKTKRTPVIINDGKLYHDEELDSFHGYINFSDNITNKEEIISKDLVYIIFTSGTTGKPKGVMISHENISPFMTYVVERFKHNKDTKTLSKTPISFDPFLTEIVPSFISGGTVLLYKDLISIKNFLKTLQDGQITNFGCGPALLLLLEENRNILQDYDLSNLNQIYFGYESCPINTIKILQNELPHVSFINGYGTTETFASSTFYEIENLQDKEIETFPIGRPIKGTELMILNENKKLTKPGEIGELVVRGTTVMNGYWKNKEKTDEVLRPNPLFSESLEKVYFTGDLVKRDKDNNIIFVGRKDDQVKIQGYRVELSEVQRRIEENNLVKECCVIAVEKGNSKRIVCYLITNNNSKEELEVIKKCSVETLESYKIPQEWIFIDQMPRNANSKVDKKKLEGIYYNQQ